MAIWQTIKGIVAAGRDYSGSVASHEDSYSDVQHPQQWIFGSAGKHTQSGKKVSAGNAISLPAVMHAVRLLSTVFALAPMNYFFRKPDGDKDRMAGHPLQRLVHLEPSHLPAFAHFELKLQDLLLAGGAYYYVHRDNTQYPKRLSRLDPVMAGVDHHWDKSDGSTFFYSVTLPDGSRERLSSHEIFHIPGFSRNGLVGLDPFTFMKEAIGEGLAVSEFAQRYFANDATPGSVLFANGHGGKSLKISREDRERIKKDWEAQFRGPGKSHKLAVLDQADWKLERVGFNLKESEMVESRSFNVVEIARCFGVPPHLMFELSKATFSNIEQQSLEFLLYFMQPHFSRVEGWYSKYFAEENHFFQFNTNSLVRGDIRSRYEVYKISREIGMNSANELRRRENENSIGPEGDDYTPPVYAAPQGNNESE